jgi:XRE family transcriptional regulator, stress-response regulator
MTVLLREAIGGSLRRARTSRRRTLREVSHQARVSLGYLSEVERGRKEASSELLAAICEALEFPLSELLYEVAELMRPVQPVQPLVPIGTRHADIRRAVTPQPAGPSRTPATALVRVAA